MLKKLQILTILSFISCTTPEKKVVESRWGELEKVESVSCSAWPVKEAELDVSQMIVSVDGDGGFIAMTRLRNGSVLPMYASTGGDDVLNSDELQSFPIGRNAHVLAVAEWRGEPIAFVAQNKNERAWIEARGIRDNKLVARMSTPIDDEVVSGRLVKSAQGWWLQLNHSETESSYLSVNPGTSTAWTFVPSKLKSLTRSAAIISSGADLSADVIEIVRNGDDTKGRFKLTRLNPTGDFNDVGTFTVGTKGGLESWSAVTLGSRVVLAIVRGDSMIGQASLVLTAISLSGPEPVVAWTRDFDLPDVHLGEPIWMSNGSKALVGLMKWIDGEAAMTRIKVDAYGAKSLVDMGIFEKGTALVSGYIGAKEKGLGAFRYRSDDLWKYKLCKLSL